MEYQNHFQNHFCLSFEGQELVDELTLWHKSVAVRLSESHSM